MSLNFVTSLVSIFTQAMTGGSYWELNLVVDFTARLLSHSYTNTCGYKNGHCSNLMTINCSQLQPKSKCTTMQALRCWKWWQNNITYNCHKTCNTHLTNKTRPNCNRDRQYSDTTCLGTAYNNWAQNSPTTYYTNLNKDSSKQVSRLNIPLVI